MYLVYSATFLESCQDCENERGWILVKKLKIKEDVRNRTSVLELYVEINGCKKLRQTNQHEVRDEYDVL